MLLQHRIMFGCNEAYYVFVIRLSFWEYNSLSSIMLLKKIVIDVRHMETIGGRFTGCVANNSLR